LLLVEPLEFPAQEQLAQILECYRQTLAFEKSPTLGISEANFLGDLST
jgi:hypothetical protein